MANSITFETGLVTFDINNTGRTVTFNPTDAGYAEKLRDLVDKLAAIEKQHESADEDVLTRLRTTDQDMRAEVDDFFGAGFCADVFGDARLLALSGGLTLIEQLLYAIVDQMDSSIREAEGLRKQKLEKYTKKYSRYTTKK